MLFLEGICGGWRWQAEDVLDVLDSGAMSNPMFRLKGPLMQVLYYLVLLQLEIAFCCRGEERLRNVDKSISRGEWSRTRI